MHLIACLVFFVCYYLERLSIIFAFIIIFGLRKSQSFLAFLNRKCERNYKNHFNLNKSINFKRLNVVKFKKFDLS
jgi:hypothetical protein